MTLTAHLLTLESGGLIRLARLMPEVEYLFRHALLQEAAYHSLVKLDRRMLHQAVGQSLERLHPGRLASPELAPILARHFAEAGDDSRALRYYTQAGRAAAQVYANAEAIQHFEHAIASARRQPEAAEQVAELYLLRGRALELNAQDAQAIANYEALETWAAARGDRHAQLVAMAARATILVKPSVEGDPSLGYALSRQALALAGELGDRPAEAKALWNLLLYHAAIGENAAALEHGERALAIAREHDLREQRAYVLTDLLKVYYQVGQPDLVRAALEEARSLWRELGILNMLADNLGSTSMLHIFSGHYDRALATSNEALLVSQQIGNLWNQSYAHYMVELVYFDRGDIGRAIAVAEDCLRLAGQAGFAEGLHQASFDLALIYAFMGDLQRAIQTAQLALDRAQTLPGAIPVLPQLVGLVAFLDVLAGRLAEAQAVLDDSGFLRDPEALQRQFILTQAVFALARAELALARDDPEQALELAAGITLALRQSTTRLFLADALTLHGRALRAAGQLEAAQSAFESARAEAEDLGSRRNLWQILAELAGLAAGRGELPAAQALYRRSLDHINYIAEHAGSAELRESYLRRPEVRAVLRQAGRGH